MTDNQGPAHKKDMTRRRVILAGGAVFAAAGVGAGVVATASADEETSAAAKGGQGDACYRLTSETTEGPYYIDADRIRKDITEDKEGIPLTLRLKVIDSDTCKPLKRAAVDIWHCDALGIYSGYESMSQGGPGGGTPPSGAPTDMPTDAPTGTPTGTPPPEVRAVAAGTANPPTTSAICGAHSSPTSTATWSSRPSSRAGTRAVPCTSTPRCTSAGR